MPSQTEFREVPSMTKIQKKDISIKNDKIVPKI